VYAAILSKSGKEILKSYKIKFEFDTEVEYIINRDKTGMCPFENAVLNVEEPLEALTKVEETLSKLRNNSREFKYFKNIDYGNLRLRICSKISILLVSVFNSFCALTSSSAVLDSSM
jgi:hypothetical protein